MSAEVYFSLESACTRATLEGFEAGVLAAVGDEVGGLTERLTTLSAHIRLLSCGEYGRHLCKLMVSRYVLVCPVMV